MNRVHDLVVVGGGVAGTTAVLTAVSRGLDVAWIADRVSARDQSAHWHGHLHRGRLYDPVREADLIEELGQNVPFWWSNAVVRFHSEVPTVALGPDERWAASFRRRLGGTRPTTGRPGYLADGVVSVRTDEAILDGPAFLGAATRTAAHAATRIDGRCTALRRTDRGAWAAELRSASGEPDRVLARTVALATGTAADELVPAGLRLGAALGARLSRMLVLRGQLPPAAAIIPSRSAGGLFFASREVPEAAPGERVWLVSDGFSSPGTTSPGPLTDGWWACSVLERLGRFVRPDLLDAVEVGGYLAAKSRVESSPTQVPARGFAADADGTFVSLMPSKWSTAPTTAVRALDALIPDPLPSSARTLAVAELLAVAQPPATAPFAETWRSVRETAPLPALRGPSLGALRQAADLFRPLEDAPVAVPVRAVA